MEKSPRVSLLRVPPFSFFPFAHQAVSRIPNTRTCRRRLVALSHEPWRLLSSHRSCALFSCELPNLSGRRETGGARREKGDGKVRPDAGGFALPQKGARDLRSNPKLVFRHVISSALLLHVPLFFYCSPLSRNPEDNGFCTLRDHHSPSLIFFILLFLSVAHFPRGGYIDCKRRTGWFTRTRLVYVRRRDARSFFSFSILEWPSIVLVIRGQILL